MKRTPTPEEKEKVLDAVFAPLEAASGSSAAHCSAHPSVADLRTAAKVIRWATGEAMDLRAKDPWLKRTLYALFAGTDANEMLRKSAVLEGIADQMENDSAPNDPAHRPEATNG